MIERGSLGTSGFAIQGTTNNALVQNTINIGGTQTVVGICDTTNVATHLPDVNSAHPSLSGFVVTSTNTEPLPNSLTRITIVYTAYFVGTPSTSYVEDITTKEELPIQEHPSYSSSWATSKPSVTSYLAPTASVVKTEYFNSRPDARITDNGKLSHPGSDFPGDATNWLILSSRRQQQNDSLWTIETTYQYSNPVWDGDLYQTL